MEESTVSFLLKNLEAPASWAKNGMYYPNRMIEEAGQHSVGKWGRMQREYPKEQHPSHNQRLILNGTFGQASNRCNRQSDIDS